MTDATLTSSAAVRVVILSNASTGALFDANEQQMYWYRKSDKTFWERVHFLRNTTKNASEWAKVDDYVKITRAQFIAQVLPTYANKNFDSK